jgi:hypothetical protein
MENNFNYGYGQPSYQRPQLRQYAFVNGPEGAKAYQMLTQSKNPTQLFYNIAKNNPNMKPALDLLQNGYSPQQVFEQMCKQRGLNPQDVLSKKQGKAFHYYLAMKN